MQSIIRLTASELVAEITSKNISVHQVAEASLSQVEKMEGINAVCSVEKERVLQQADELDNKLESGNSLPLHGVPFVIKDNIDTKGIKTTGGTPALADNIPEQNAGVVQKLLDAGALIIGKAKLHELAFGITSNNGFSGAVRNPYNLDMIPGGSSGGSAAAVSGHLVPASLGTDTGGSSRIPGALCGVCGFRPSTDRYPTDGLIGLSHTRDTAGPFARSVEDIQLIDSVLSGDNSTEEINVSTIKVGIPRNPHFQNTDPDVAQVMEDTLDKLKNAGIQLVEQDIDIEELREKTSFVIALHECRENIEAYLSTLKSGITYYDVLARLASPDVLGTLQAIESGEAAVPDKVYEQAMSTFRPQLQQVYADYFSDNAMDVIVMPTTILTARPIGHDETVDLNGEQVPTFPTFARNTDANSVIGLPSLSIPAGLGNSGLPVGLLIDGPIRRDKKVLAIGRAIEAILPAIPAPAF